MVSVRMAALAGAGLFCGMQAAIAADMPPIIQKAPPPIEEFGGWYLRGDIGFSNQAVRQLRFVKFDGTIPDQHNLSKGFDSAGIFRLGVGYQFNSWLRADVTGEYRMSAHFQALNDVDQGGGDFEPEHDFASKSEFVVLANVYADLGTWWCVTPFIGAGVGAADIRISNFQDFLNNGATGLGNPGNAGFPGANNFANPTSKWNLAWALHAGIAYKVTPNLSVELAYRYLHLGDATTGPMASFDILNNPNPSTQLDHNEFRHLYSHDLTLGVRWLLAPPPPAEPLYPLVRKG
jgi:opacity protein-like surface antigen